MAIFTASTYASNTEVRSSYPEIDSLLPATQIDTEISGASTALTSIDVPSTQGFPTVGEITIMDSSNTVQQMSYAKKDETKFYLDTGQTGASSTYEAGALVASAEYLLNRHRVLAKGYVDAKVPNTTVPADMKKLLEIMWTFYLATKGHHDAAVRAWGAGVRQEFADELSSIRTDYPVAIRQSVCKLVEESLSDDEIDELKYGPEGDQ